MSHRAASRPLTKYTNFKVPVANVLAPRGKGAAAVVEKAFSISAALVGAMSVGIIRTTFSAALKFAREDTRGGTVPVLHLQSLADLLINAKIKIDTSRILVWKALSGLEKGAGDDSSRYETCSQAKVYCSDQAVRAVWETMQWLEYTVFPRLLNDAIVYSIFDGGNIGLVRCQLQGLMQAEDYKPWASLY
ncbi:hypothetical protein QQZ08_006206 [Neonectria magnoliae]|uniref:Acyl-CoA dehydrogenase/oxidase C-terminal domain-containing protein n=1 Tax=Neonectria magnoliae TaxID=2732573 RepID=A0ABR1I197_9HYPO